MILLGIIMVKLLLINADSNTGLQYCHKKENSCKSSSRRLTDSAEERFMFYDINSEGFNLRREVYKRYAVMIKEAQTINTRMNWRLVLPPWYNVSHWRSDDQPKPWSAYFDIKTLKSFAPVVEMFEVFSKLPSNNKMFEINVLFMLLEFDDSNIKGDIWKIEKGCQYYGEFWGYKNITVQEIVCVRLQGPITMLWELIDSRPFARTIMFANSKMCSHKTFEIKNSTRELQKQYWKCRLSMRFNSELETAADTYVRRYLDCDTRGCSTYISVHWRRQDFEQERFIPSVNTTVSQIHDFIKLKCPNINKVYIATDACHDELSLLKSQLLEHGYKVYHNSSNKVSKQHDEGALAIIEQLICARSAYFIGTVDSTFTFRIQEEREIIGFASKTTFNVLCRDDEDCKKKISAYPIVSRVDEGHERVCI